MKAILTGDARAAAIVDVAGNFLVGKGGAELQAFASGLTQRLVYGGIDGLVLGEGSSIVRDNPEYKQMFEEAFPGIVEGALGRARRSNAAKAIAAFERTMLANKAPFQNWLRRRAGGKCAQPGACGVDEVDLGAKELRGAALFFDEAKTGCVGCHTGPALSSDTFHALGFGDLHDDTRETVRDTRTGALPTAKHRVGAIYGARPFNGADPGRGGFTGRAGDLYKFRTPSLYNVADASLLGHGASFYSVRELVRYYNCGGVPAADGSCPAQPRAQNGAVPAERLSPELRPLGLTPGEVNDLTAFLETALRDPELARYLPAGVTSACSINDDPASRTSFAALGISCSGNAGTAPPASCGPNGTCVDACSRIASCQPEFSADDMAGCVDRCSCDIQSAGAIGGTCGAKTAAYLACIANLTSCDDVLSPESSSGCGNALAAASSACAAQ